MPKYADFGPLDSDDARTVIAMTVEELARREKAADRKKRRESAV